MGISRMGTLGAVLLLGLSACPKHRRTPNCHQGSGSAAVCTIIVTAKCQRLLPEKTSAFPGDIIVFVSEGETQGELRVISIESAFEEVSKGELIEFQKPDPSDSAKKSGAVWARPVKPPSSSNVHVVFTDKRLPPDCIPLDDSANETKAGELEVVPPTGEEPR